MKIDIRHVQPQDLDAIHEMFISSHVIHGTMRIPHHSLAYIEKRIEPRDNMVKLVACIDNEVVGYAELATHPDAPLEAKNKLHDSDHSVEHTIVDTGSDEYTLGRPHPMIDGTLRKQRILTEARDPQTAILLLDFILDYNASMDPVGKLINVIVEARQTVKKRGGNLPVVASICGTDGDPQDLNLQTKLLIEAGVIVFHSNTKAASFCCEMLK